MDRMHAQIIAQKLLSDTFTNGGASLTPTGVNVDFGLWTGYIVSDSRHTMTVEKPNTLDDIPSVVYRIMEWLTKYPLPNGMFYGSWYDRDNGLIHFDHSKLYESLSIAWHHAIINGQKAIYDVALDHSFPVASGVGHTGIADGVQSHSSGPIYPYRLVDEAFDQDNGCIIAYNPKNQVIFRAIYSAGKDRYSQSLTEAYRVAERFCWIEKQYFA